MSPSLKFLLKNIKVQNIFNKSPIPNEFFLHNTAVLYFLFLSSLLYLFYLGFRNDVTSVAVFILIGFISSFFTKNMIVILFLSLTLTSIVTWDPFSQQGFEGFEIATEPPEDNPKEEEKDIKENDNKKAENAKEQQEPMIADPMELDAEANLKKSPKMPLEKQSHPHPLDDNALEKIQKQTRQILDTHNDILSTMEKIKPYLKEMNDLGKTASLFLGDTDEKSS